MNNLKTITIIALFAISLFSFTLAKLEVFEFSYPNRENTSITMNTDKFKKFDKVWQGLDYHYDSKSKEGITCNVLYFKLTKKEQQQYVDPHGNKISSEIAFNFFSAHAPHKKQEQQIHHWGNKEDDFMFRQANIYELYNKDKDKMIQLNQKDMYGYCMIDKDLFVNVHLSKNNYTTADSIAMVEILKTLKKKKISE